MSPTIATACTFSQPEPAVASSFTTDAIRLEELLANHGVAARVGQASLSADTIRFPLQLGLGITTRRILGLSHDLAKEAGYSRCRLRREGHSLFLELPRDAGMGLRYGDLLAKIGDLPYDSALLGMMDSGAPVILRVTNPSVRHLLVTGAARVGKSELLRLLGLGIAAHHGAKHWRLALLDSRSGGPVASLHALPHCWAWCKHPAHAIGWLIHLMVEMEGRERKGQFCPRVLSVVDDVDALLTVGGSSARHVLHALLERGADVGIHLALACRESEPLEELQALLPVHLRGEGPKVPGRFHLHHEQAIVPITIARLDSDEVRAVVERIRFGRPRIIAHIPECRAST
ncbi:MAG: FtsK/SpoIIIE domain-containing protein [Chloroflexota bacterium]|nr:FtsK/SpoIIIE domain-containing protein [Chloroflexota bacterium]